MKRVTVEDIAKQVGVTKGLVSRALTGKYNVSEKMRDEITRAAVALGYDFNKLRAKKKGRSVCVLVITSEMLLKEDYWRPIIRALTAGLDKERIDVDYFIFDERAVTDTDVQKLKDLESAAYVFVGNSAPQLLSVASSSGLPTVVVDPKCDVQWDCLSVTYSNFDSCKTLTKQLLACGHRYFVFYAPKEGVLSFDERRAGAKSAVSEVSGATITEVLFDNSNGAFASDEMLKAALEQNEDVTAIICANDIIAYGAMNVIAKMGKKVPTDYSVTGFDNLAESGAEQKNLTTVNVPREALGEEAAKYVVGQLGGKSIAYTRVVVRCETIIRGSIKKIYKGAPAASVTNDGDVASKKGDK